MPQRKRRARLLALGIALTVLITAAVAGTRNSNPRVIPPNARYGGHSYGEWQALAWPWELKVPWAANPIIPGNDEQDGVAGRPG